MSATGFHPDPSANEPWTRTTLFTALSATEAETVPMSAERRTSIVHFMHSPHRLFTALPIKRGQHYLTVDVGGKSDLGVGGARQECRPLKRRGFSDKARGALASTAMIQYSGLRLSFRWRRRALPRRKSENIDFKVTSGKCSKW